MTSPANALSLQSPVGVAPDGPAATAPVPEDGAAGSFSALLTATETVDTQPMIAAPDGARSAESLRGNLLLPTLKRDMLDPPPTPDAGIAEQTPITLAEPVEIPVVVPPAASDTRERIAPDQTYTSDDAPDDPVSVEADTDAPIAGAALALSPLAPAIAPQGPPRASPGKTEPGQKTQTASPAPLAATLQMPDANAISVQFPETPHPSMLRNIIQRGDPATSAVKIGEKAQSPVAVADYVPTEKLSNNGTIAAQHTNAAIDRLGPAPATTVAAQPGHIGRELGVAIAHHVAAGADEVTVRLDPAHYGQIEVKMRFDAEGRLNATITASQSATLDMLRRDSANLNQALGDAGFRTDAHSFTFDSRSADAQHRERAMPQTRDLARSGGLNEPDNISLANSPAPDWRPLRGGGRINMIA